MASGLVCAHARAYVIGGDERDLGAFGDAALPGALQRLLAGDLPHDVRERKRRKPDFETLLHLPPSRDATGGTLVALGSGSSPTR